MKRRKSLMIISILSLGLFFISGCGDGVPEGTLNTTGATVTFTSDAAGLSGLSAGQSCILTAELKDKSLTCTGGTCTSAPQPLSSQEIAFSFIFNESGATLTPLNGGITDSLGKAYVVYTAGKLRPGLNIMDTIQANIKDFSGVVTITRKGGGGSTAGFTIDVTATAPSVKAGGTSIITATVSNADGDLVSGQWVSFAFVANNSGASLVAAGLTDAGGKATAIYTAGGNSPTLDLSDTVSASITGSVGAIAITRTAGTAPVGYSITVIPSPLTVPTIGGSSVIKATVTGPIVSGVTVNFTTTAGSVSPLSATTDGSGNAETVFTVGAGVTKTTAGVVTASITADGSTYSASVIITYP